MGSTRRSLVSLNRKSIADAHSEAGRPALWMHSSIEALERAVLEQTLMVERNPVLRWAVLGAAVIQDGAGNRKLSKRKAESRTGRGPFSNPKRSFWLRRMTY